MIELFFSSVMSNVKSSKARKASGRILLEGERLIADAMNAGANAETIFFSDTKLLTTLPLIKYPSIELYQVHHSKIQLWSDLITSPGIMGK
jgi:tRNA G18 (ribose-2'-O)-methylase SpoU